MNHPPLTQEERWLEQVGRQVRELAEDAPPLTDDQRETLRVLFTDAQDPAA